MAAGVNEAGATKALTVEELEKEVLGPKKNQAEKNEEKKPPRDAGKFGVVFLTSLFWLALLSAVVLFTVFDPTEDNIIRGKILMLLNPEEETREVFYAPDIIAFQDWERELDERERELDLFEGELDLREGSLDERESDIEDREYEVESMLDAIREGGYGIGQPVTDITQIVKTIERMTPAEAARTLEEIEFEKALLVCATMGAKKLAPIMDAMELDFRVMLWDELLATPEYEDLEWD